MLANVCAHIVMFQAVLNNAQVGICALCARALQRSYIAPPLNSPRPLSSHPDLQAACELCWRTVCASHLNADELARCGGVSIICRSPTSHEAVVCTHLLRSIAGFAASEVARPQLAAVPGLLPNIVRCGLLRRAHATAEAALVAVGHLCASSALQMDLVHANALAHLIPLMFWCACGGA